MIKNLFIIIVGSLVTSLTAFDVYFNMIISYSTVIFLVHLFHKKRFFRTTVEYFALLAFLAIMELICIFIYNNCVSKYQGDFSTIIILLLPMLIFIFAICYFTPIIKKHLNYDENMKLLLCFVINLLGYVVILKVIWDHDMMLVLNNILELLFTIISVLSVNIFLYFYLIKVELEKKESKVQNKYSEILNNITEDIRARQHDFKNHLNVMNGLIESTKGVELEYNLKEYISSLNNSMMIMEDIVYIKNPILRAIIYIKLIEANKKNIKFLYNISNLLIRNVKYYELSEILNNIIDNAFDALDGQVGEKSVSVKTYLEGESNIIEIMNSGITLKPENIKRIFERGFSTKQGNNRGYGLYNAKKIVERTGGKIQLSLENGFTIFKLFIQ
ncbi:GHKL domain-containing protein [Clostridium estertheticum]|uniref:sensor histidine kinase n=1 Tax=Clostridium estertheticum TaxID=238834 RepID=UPI001CF2BCEE|nr:ATP-binding protein [Clostridium estertheticum]MCB2306232.1 GHKL domain-containing protein [Clostridium estertheticum]MCB2344405.1 GHKL domain-containing protein [Clostridium estertheticum]MCB2349324.1 GHKL domain-containing protein [Clostridium estertheticum]WAG45068.1 GHKL domain-containing protein [Clostridium estertheticum]